MKYRSEIDGLRALALIPVIFFHAGFKIFSGGYVGVDVFFVISGYLITSILLSDLQSGSFSIINFYERRARRILPALFLVMFTIVPLAWIWLLPTDLKSFSESLVAVPIFASNILFWHTSGYFDVASELKPLIHTWSLAVEEQYYVLFPLFLMVTWKLGKRWIIVLSAVIGAISLGASQWGSHTHPAFTFFLLPMRCWELIIGVLCAFYFDDQSIKKHKHYLGEVSSLIGFFLITFSVFFFNDKTPFPSIYALVPTIGAVLIIAFGTRKTLVGKLLGSKLFVGIGLISYSAYLWHQPLFAFVRQRSLNEPSLLLMSTLALASLFLAYLSWQFVERPFRNKHRFSRHQVFTLGVACSALFIAIGMAGYLSGGYLNQGDTTATRQLLSTNMSIFKAQVKYCWEKIKISPTVESACQIGTSDSIPSFAIIGDSSIGALVEPLNSETLNYGISGFNYTFRNCPPLKAIAPLKFSDEEKKCSDLRQSFFNGLEQKSPIPNIIIFGARYSILIDKKRFDNNEGGVEHGDEWIWDMHTSSDIEYKKAIAENLTDSIKSILTSGRKVILIYPIPEAGWDVPKRLAKIYQLNHSINTNDASTSYLRFIERNREAYTALDSIGENKNLIRVKPENIFCNTLIQNRCITNINGTPLYFDNNHLSNAGARLINAEIIKHLIQKN
jgi:peptidoglycan/LPS O-acetylase OafA/YrhL